MRWMMHRLLQLSWQDRLLLLETLFWLILASLAISILPFRQLGRLASFRGPSQRRRWLDNCQIRWAVIACANRMPWRAVCFQKGLAAHFMLRTRGIPSVLYLGAALDEQRGLSAHVWVRADDVDVIGGEIASRYAVLATFPPENYEKA